MIRRYSRIPRWVPYAFAIGLVMGGLSPAARAADEPEKPFEEPGITYMQRGDAYISWIAGSLFIVACLIVAFKNPHRSHLD